MREISDSQFKELVCVSCSDTGYGGFKKELLSQNLSELEESLLLCPNCKGVMREASVWNGATTCYDCCDNANGSSISLLVRRTTSKMEAVCPLSGGGCQWRGGLSEVRGHLSFCKFLSMECPYTKFGCTYTSVVHGEVEKHTRENTFYHLEMRMNLIEIENSQIREKNASIELQLTALMKKATLTKFIESMKMCLEGVEWRLDDEQLRRAGNELLGPDFYMRGGYHLQLEGRKVENQILFHVRRIKGEFDRCLSGARLTHSCIDQLGREKTTYNSHDLKLDVGNVSESIHQAKCVPSVHRFYFHIDLI